MEYNLFKNGLWSYNLSIGNVFLDFYITQGLFDLSLDVPVILYQDDILCFEVDLKERIASSYIKYYFLPSVSGTTVSGILFEYKNQSFEDYTPLSTMSGSGFYYSSFPAEDLYPRYIRITHDVGTISGSLCGFELINNDVFVGFGQTNSLFKSDLSASRGLTYVATVPVYNNNEFMATANVQIEPTGSYMDQYIYLSSSEEGPWVNILSKNKIIANSSVWLTDLLSDSIHLKDGILKIKGEDTTGRWATNIFEAVYTSLVFNFDTQYYSSLFIDMGNSEIGCYIATDFYDSTVTFEVKSLPKPSDYLIYRKITHVYDYNYYFVIKDFDLSNGSFIEDLNEYSDLGGQANAGLSNYIVSINNTGESAILIGTSKAVILVTLDSLFNINYERVLNQVTDNGHYFYQVEPDFGGGAWIHLYCDVGSTSYPVNQQGYFLFHYNDSNVQTFKMSTGTRVIYVFSVIPNSTNIWCTNTSEQAVIKLSNGGNILSLYSNEYYTNDVRGCCSLEDGGCWFINGNSLYRIDSSGNLIDLIENISDTNVVAYVSFYSSDSLIVRDGDLIYRIYVEGVLKGRRCFTSTVAYADRLIVDNYGIFVYCTTGFMYKLDPTTGAITHTIGSSINNSSRVYGLFKKTIDDSDYVWKHRFPMPTDSVWSNTSFSKVQENSYYFSKDYYHQLRLTLRANKPYNKYDVPLSIETWEPDDSFSNEVGCDLPYEHRWCIHNKVLVDVVSGTCCLYCNEADPIGDPHVYVCTNDRWYIKGRVHSNDVDSAYDIQIDYMLPDSGDITLYLSVTPHNNSSDYIRAVLRRTGSSMTFKIEDHQSNFSWGDIIGPELTIDPVQNNGKIRLTKNGARYGQAYFYNSTTNSWVVSALTLSKQGGLWTTTDFGDEENWNIRVGAYGDSFVILDNFLVNDAKVYWYVDSPLIKGIYLKDYVVLDNIYPNNYKNVYIKTDVPKLESNYVPSMVYDYQLRAWWELYL